MLGTGGREHAGFPHGLAESALVYFNKLHNLEKTKAAMRAYKLMLSRRFHPWESGEGKITAQYTLALLQMARKALKEGRFAGTEKLLHDALAYPENLGEGKLEGTKDDHMYYHLALEGRGEQRRRGHASNGQPLVPTSRQEPCITTTSRRT